MIIDELKEKGIAVDKIDDETLSMLKLFIRGERTHEGSKSYLKDLLGENVPMAIRAVAFPYKRVALEYLGEGARLENIALWKTELSAGTPKQSQRWHRDPLTNQLKIFVYLSDVDKTAGPLFYVPYSVEGMKYGKVNPQVRGWVTKLPPKLRKKVLRWLGKSNYPDPLLIDTLIPEKDRQPILGKAGTIIYADTSGLHKGGYCTEKVRYMLVISFVPKHYKK